MQKDLTKFLNLGAHRWSIDGDLANEADKGLELIGKIKVLEELTAGGKFGGKGPSQNHIEAIRSKLKAKEKV